MYRYGGAIQTGTRGCVDAGTEQCPCHLALTGDCLICDRLQGKDDCDCNWEGVCPYTVFVQNGNEVSDFRPECMAPLVQRKEYGEGVAVLVLRVGRGFAQKASLPGSFVFLRRAGEKKDSCDARRAEPERTGALGDVHYYDVPVSVLKADETSGQIHLAIRREGPKSKLLLGESVEDTDGNALNPGRFLIRGVYRSGLIGSDYLKTSFVKGKKLLFVTKGIGAAPAILAMDHLKPLLGSGTMIRWLADEEKVGQALLEEYAVGESKGGAVTPEYLSLAGPRREARLPEDHIRTVLRDGRFDVVCLMMSDYYIDQLKAVVQGELPEAKLVWNNNAVMCCGEGICGACTEVTADGRVIRRCKCRGDSDR